MMSRFNTFFDPPADRPHESYRAKRTTTKARVVSQGKRGSVMLDGLTAGSLWIRVHLGAALVHVEAVLSIDEDHRANLYDAGLFGNRPSGKQLAWMDTEGAFQREPITRGADDRRLTVRHRTILVENNTGLVACFPPPR